MNKVKMALETIILSGLVFLGSTQLNAVEEKNPERLRPKSRYELRHDAKRNGLHHKLHAYHPKSVDKDRRDVSDYHIKPRAIMSDSARVGSFRVGMGPYCSLRSFHPHMKNFYGDGAFDYHRGPRGIMSNSTKTDHLRDGPIRPYNPQN
ncbi:MAG: hypothetical protein KKB65_07935 [Nanoarchaeota archaeon]|nr:hypothetical protein [Nanoarchaeota archaeon]MBU1850140.1 hypothetical protein [Nanoarchaeota archaeon]